MILQREAIVHATVLCCAICFASLAQAADLPTGFIETDIRGPWNEAVGITFAADGRAFVWERSGRVHMQDDDHWHVVIDIHDEVGGWRDHGLLGVALHPNFLVNGQIFLLYVVDHHHLEHAGLPSYDPDADEYFRATIGRITRYTLDAAEDFHAIVPSSRTILLGETKSTGIPILFESHGVGDLLFGTDGTLLASCGEAAHYVIVDTGGPASYAAQALGEGILQPKEDIGAFRSQLIDTQSGKILRLDPDTGDGVPSNPFYDQSAPRAPRSRVWALGFRNPCRMTLRPGTGSHNPMDADPGVLYIGDVGWGVREELNVCDGPGQNFGWPLFEGFDVSLGYVSTGVENLDAPNPLTDAPGCDQEYFTFADLLLEDTLVLDPFMPNPCDEAIEIPPSIPTFIHRRPEIDWRHNDIGPARTGIFVGDEAATILVGAAGSPVSGESFGGNCSIAGTWYTGSSYPRQYRNTYFHADYGLQWAKYFTFDANNRPVEAQPFLSGAGEIVNMAAHPITGDLYYVAWNSVKHIEWAPGDNQPPTAVATSDFTFGPGPLTVQFMASDSTDPELDQLEYQWDFGDGSPTSNEADPIHTFTPATGDPTSFLVTLTVTDAADNSDQTTILVSVNNTPPIVNIISPVEGSTYPMIGNSDYALVADVTDAEHDVSERTCAWQTVLHHNNHTHEDPVNEQCLTSTTLSPAGCDGNLYFFRISLTVTDAEGLTGFDFVDVYPDCSGNIAPMANDNQAEVAIGGAITVELLINDDDVDGSLDPAGVAVVVPPLHGMTSLDERTGTVTYIHDGSFTTTDQFGYTVNDDDGGTSNIATVLITIIDAVAGDLNGDGKVSELDRAMLCMALGSTVGDREYFAAADINADTFIDQLDQVLFNEILPPCAGDVVSNTTFQPPGDGDIDGADLAFVLAAWGSGSSCADMVSSATFEPPPDGVVDGADLGYLLISWGSCE